jgi:SHS2 domain-containing protein
MHNRGFRPLNHTADKSIEAWAPTLPDLFCAAAEGMFSGSADCTAITPDQEWPIQVQAASLEDLLHAWLSELLWVSERDAAALCHFEIADLQGADDGGWRARGCALRRLTHTSPLTSPLVVGTSLSQPISGPLSERCRLDRELRMWYVTNRERRWCPMLHRPGGGVS